MEFIKIQKFFTDNGIMSRRAAEEEIKKGRVSVNGKTAEIGMRVDPDTDVITYLGKEIKPSKKENVYILLNKPRGIVTTMSDEKGRTTVSTLVANAGARVYPVGRLDMDSDGLLILTNDGNLTNILTHPRHTVPKIYEVTVAGEVSDEKLRILRAPLDIDGYEILPVKTEIVSIGKSETILKMTLFEGRNRQIRKMCEIANLRIKKLTRVAIGDISLGNLATGKWRFLSDDEVAMLYNENNDK